MEQTPLFKHTRHPHVPHRITIDEATKDVAGFNTAIALWLTRHVGSMWMAYAFMLLSLIGLLAILGIISPSIALLVAWLSQTFIQLVLLPVIMVGQNVLSAHSELQAQEEFDTTEKTYHDLEQLIEHMNAQDKEIMRQGEALDTIVETLARAARRVHGKSLD